MKNAMASWYEISNLLLGGELLGKLAELSAPPLYVE